MTRNDIIREIPYRPNRLKMLLFFLLGCVGVGVWVYFALYANQPVNIRGVRLTAAQFRLLLRVLAPLPAAGFVILSLLLFRTFTRTQRVAFTKDSIIVPAPSRIGLSGEEVEICYEDIWKVVSERSLGVCFANIVHKRGSAVLHATMFPSRRDFESVVAYVSAVVAERPHESACGAVQAEDDSERATASLPFHLRYELNRRQRLVPHLLVSLRYIPGLVLMVGGSVYLTVAVSRWCFPVVIVALWFTRRFFAGLICAIAIPVVSMDVVVEPDRMGLLVNNNRVWLPLDSNLYIANTAQNVWTICFPSGAVINIPCDSITGEQIEYLSSAVQRHRNRSQTLSVSTVDGGAAG